MPILAHALICSALKPSPPQAGVAETKWAIEYDQAAADAFALNNPDAKVFCNNCNVLLRVRGGGGGGVWWCPASASVAEKMRQPSLGLTHTHPVCKHLTSSLTHTYTPMSPTHMHPQAAMAKAGLLEDCDACEDCMTQAAALTPEYLEGLPLPGEVNGCCWQWWMGGPLSGCIEVQSQEGCRWM